jgi:superkiller protein 3
VLSEALWRAGARDSALTVRRRALESHPQDFDLCFRLAVRLEMLDERGWNEASGTFRGSLPESTEHWGEAVDTYRIALALRPEHHEALHRMGMALQQLKRHADAERAYRRLLARSPTNPDLIHHLGGSLHAQSKYQAAADEYERVLAIDPRKLFTLVNISSVLINMGKYHDAEQYARRALDVDFNHATAHCNLGTALNAQGSFERAIESFQAALKIDPEFAVAFAGLAFAAYRQGEYKQAIEDYHRCLDLDPGFAPAHFYLGRMQREMGDVEAALRAFESARALYTKADTPVAREFRAEAEAEIESIRRAVEVPEAIAHLESVLRHDSRNVEAHRELARIELQRNEYEAAVERLCAGLEVAQEDAHLHAEMGRALISLGRLDDAIDSLQRAIDLDPRLAPPRVNLGNIWRTQGKIDQALSSFAAARELFSSQDSDFARLWMVRLDEVIVSLRVRAGAPQVLARERRAASSEEWAAAIAAGLEQGRLAEVVALTEETLRNSPELIDDAGWGTYNSACAAARLARDPQAELAADESSRIRELARAWLTREVTTWAGWIGGEASRAAEGVIRLQNALQDPDFAGLRDVAIDELPEEERAAWRELWSTIERALEEERR